MANAKRKKPDAPLSLFAPVLPEQSAPAVRAVEPTRFGHAVLDASAGTGKTYTIVQMVLERLRGGVARLPEMLILTFTEKAAAELRLRVRQGLVQALLTASGATADAYRQAVQDYAQASIFTLHGFCNRVLHEFGFENGLPFNLAVVDDQPVYETALKQIQRGGWPEWYGAELPDVLAVADYPSRRNGRSHWEQNLLGLARQVRLGPGVRLLPEGAEQFDLAQLQAEVRPDLEQLVKAWAAAPTREPAEMAQWLCRELDVNDKYLVATLATAGRLAGLAAAATAAWAAGRGVAIGDLMLDAEAIEKLGKRPKKDSSPVGVATVSAVVAAGMAIAAQLATAEHFLALRTLPAVQAAAREYKQERGWVSFEDMLEHVDRQLAEAAAVPAGSGSLLAALRARYRCAMVDEFQDTDPVQWRILRRIFVDAPAESGHHLVLIGDPKQSIYRFRRADIRTYQQACAELQAGGATAPLRVNWRSTPELLAVLNRYFAGDPAAGVEPWFDVQKCGIAFQPVAAPPPGQRRSVVHADDTGRGAVTICRMDGADSVGLQRWRYAQFIAAEITRLVGARGDGGRLQFSTAGQPAPGERLRPGDICVLAPRRKALGLLQRALAQAGIAHSIYKQGGLFETDEALQIGAVLRAVEKPGDRKRLKLALLTPFFGLTPAALERFDGFAPGHPAPGLLAGWAEWAEARRWSRLFASLLEDTGVLRRLLARAEGERQVSNLRQIVEYLSAAAYGEKLSLSALVRRLQTASEAVEEESREADIQRIDTEKSKVKLMTVHVSKGLEFPVVFLFDVVEKTNSRVTRYEFHQADGTRVHDLARDPAHKLLHQAEELQELQRLTYVAMTRARFKLYLPWVPSKTSLPQSHAGRLQALFPPADAATAAASVQWVEWDSPGVAGAAEPERVGAAAGSTLELSLPALRPVSPPVPPAADLARRRIMIESFTHLNNRAGGHVARAGRGGDIAAGSVAAEYGDRDRRDRDDDEDQWLLSDSLRDPADTLEPVELAGRELGTLVHDVLETVDFAVVGGARDPAALLADPATRQLLERAAAAVFGAVDLAVDADPRIDAALLQAATMVWNALHTPLPVRGGKLALGSLGAGGCIRELEFQYPLWPNGGAPAVSLAQEAQVHGYIDLLFRQRAASTERYVYYLLDWKTNRLEPDYSVAAMQRSMREAGYDLQHQLYTIAVTRWLAQRLPEFDPQRDFGGIFYLYLRGLNGRDAGQGVHFAPAIGPAEQAHLQARLQVELFGRDEPVAGGRR